MAVLVDGTPFALTMPYLFVEAFQANEDYYNNWLAGTFRRVLRLHQLSYNDKFSRTVFVFNFVPSAAHSYSPQS